MLAFFRIKNKKGGIYAIIFKEFENKIRRQKNMWDNLGLLGQIFFLTFFGSTIIFAVIYIDDLRYYSFPEERKQWSDLTRGDKTGYIISYLALTISILTDWPMLYTVDQSANVSGNITSLLTITIFLLLVSVGGSYVLSHLYCENHLFGPKKDKKFPLKTL